MADESVYAGARPLWMSLPGINALVEALNTSSDNLTGGRIGEPAPQAGAPAERPRGYGQSRATPEELIAMVQQQAGKGPAAGGPARSQATGVSRGTSGGMPSGLPKSLQALMDTITAAGVAKGGIARDAAGKMKMPETAKDAEAYLQALKETQVEKGNWWKPVAQAIAGGLVDPNSNNPFGEFGKRATAAFTSDEATRKADRDKKVLEKVTGIKFGATDRASRDALAEAMNKQTGALAAAEAMPADAAAEAAGKGISQLAPLANAAAHMAQVQSSNADRGSRSLPNQVKEYVSTMQQYGDKREATAIAQEFLRKAREPKPEKFDDKQAEFAQQGVMAALASVRDPDKRKQLLAAWQQDVLETRDPALSTRKLMQVINAPVGK